MNEAARARDARASLAVRQETPAEPSRTLPGATEVVETDPIAVAYANEEALSATHSAGLRCPSARTSCPGWVLSQCQVRSEAYASTRAQCTPFVEAEQRRPRPAVPPHRAAPAGTNARKPQRGWFRQVRFYTEADAAKQLRVMQASGKYGKVADARADLVPLAQVRARHSHQNRRVTAGVCLRAHARARKAVSHLDTGRRSHVRIAHY